MGDFDNSRIDHVNHLLLEQPLIRLPFELLRKNFRSAHFEAEKEGTYIKNTLKETATASVKNNNKSGGSARDAGESASGQQQQEGQEEVLRSLDAMLARARGVKRKLEAAADEEARLHRQEEARVRHLAELYSMHDVEDVKYEVWSRTRLDRLLVDYLLRHGYNESARALADERGIQLLVDIDTFEQMNRIRKSLLRGSVTEALAWCTAGDTKKELRKINSNLEFMLRYQQYIELLRNRPRHDNGKVSEALAYARKWLLPYKDSHPDEVHRACALLAFPPGLTLSIPAYADLYSAERWTTLADRFTNTHNELLSLPPIPLLHIALSSGLSALKTPACHPNSSSSSNGVVSTQASAAATTPDSVPAGGARGQHNLRHHTTAVGHRNSSAAPPSHATSMSLATSVCPICSTELNELARGVPYANHSASHVEHDLLLLPNGRVYGKARLLEYARKAGLLEGQVKDLRTGEVYGLERLKKVYIT